MVLKSGVIAFAQVCSNIPSNYGSNRDSCQMGDPNGSIPSIQPFYARPMWGSKPGSAALNSVAFVSEISIAGGVIASYHLSKRFEAVRNCRNVTKKDLKWNDVTPTMTVDAESYEVCADGVLQDVGPAEKLPLTRLYNLF